MWVSRIFHRKEIRFSLFFSPSLANKFPRAPIIKYQVETHPPSSQVCKGCGGHAPASAPDLDAHGWKPATRGRFAQSSAWVRGAGSEAYPGGRCSFRVAPSLQVIPGPFDFILGAQVTRWRQPRQGDSWPRGARPNLNSCAWWQRRGAEQKKAGGWLHSSVAHVGILGCPAEIWVHKVGPGNASHRAPLAQRVCAQRPPVRGPVLTCHHCSAGGSLGQPSPSTSHPSISLDFIPQPSATSPRPRKQKNLLTVLYDIIGILHPPDILWKGKV